MGEAHWISRVVKMCVLREQLPEAALLRPWLTWTGLTCDVMESCKLAAGKWPVGEKATAAEAFSAFPVKHRSLIARRVISHAGGLWPISPCNH